MRAGWELSGFEFTRNEEHCYDLLVKLMAPKEMHSAQDPALAQRELGSMVDHRHALVTLAGKIDWQAASIKFGALYAPGRGRPAISIRLLVGLHYLKHVFNLSDEQVVMHWAENCQRRLKSDPLGV